MTMVQKDHKHSSVLKCNFEEKNQNKHQNSEDIIIIIQAFKVLNQMYIRSEQTRKQIPNAY